VLQAMIENRFVEDRVMSDENFPPKSIPKINPQIGKSRSFEYILPGKVMDTTKNKPARGRSD
jgi:hypothetical protein